MCEIETGDPDFDEAIILDAPVGQGQRVPAGDGRIRTEHLSSMIRRLAGRSEDFVQLDVDVAHVFGHGVAFVSNRYTQEISGAIHWSGSHPYAGEREPCPRFTTSMDAAMGLAHATHGLDALSILRRAIMMLPEGGRTPPQALLPRIMLGEMMRDLLASGNRRTS